MVLPQLQQLLLAEVREYVSRANCWYELCLCLIACSSSGRVLGFYSLCRACLIHTCTSPNILNRIEVWTPQRWHPPIYMMLIKKPLSPCACVLWVIVLVEMMMIRKVFSYEWYKGGIQYFGIPSCCHVGLKKDKSSSTFSWNPIPSMYLVGCLGLDFKMRGCIYYNYKNSNIITYLKVRLIFPV